MQRELATRFSRLTLIKGTNVKGIYDADPNKNINAKFLSSLTYDYALKNNIKVMDAAAFAICRDNNIKLLVLNMNEPGNLYKALVSGENIGSEVCN